ncbi:Fur family transcriptional regulator [Paenibacillus sedimenti]|uniref:Transcriptional repressor n=1 Tax=Paenibacillus sedimenti TaxID=2770274 RepID=A0A926QHQ2_9BACL|nr:Fur family transcriptional regulator [Paenibacillus sedimenti]MBD0378507.1 transcriptional repressor [Paenibacillus sedimenti]
MNEETVLDKMKEEGLRLTPQRVHIVELLFELSHPTADQIYAMMAEKFPYVSQTTVYSTLKKLKEIGVVRELSNDGDKSSQFELAETEHWHLNCKVCGVIYDLEPNDAESLMAVGMNNGAFQVDSCRVEFYGVCTKCMSDIRHD